MADFASSQGKIWPEASVRRERGVGTRKNKDLSIFLSLSLSLSLKSICIGHYVVRASPKGQSCRQNFTPKSPSQV
jgi:hypothetical protein